MPQIDPAAPSKTWRLSAQGWGAATRLAHKLADLGPGRVVASPEPKAEDTGRVIAEAINWPFAVDAGLAEHARETVGFLPKDELEAKIARLFAEPDTLALGEETANQALARFSAAIERHRGDDTLLAAAHGTVITLWTCARFPQDAMAFWRALAAPCALVFEGEAAPRIVTS
jgi:probable phosphoglycerate mutase